MIVVLTLRVRTCYEPMPGQTLDAKLSSRGA